MKTYLQRLAERAEGVSLTPPLRPPMRSEVTREAGSDSLVEEPAGDLFVESSNASGEIPRNKAVQDSNKIVESSIQTSPRVSPRQQEPSLPAEAPLERAAFIEPRSAGNETAMPQPVTPPKERASPERSIIEVHSYAESEPTQKVEVPRETSADPERRIIEPPDAEREQPRKMEVHRETSAENSSAQLSPVRPVEKPVIEEWQSNRDEYARLEQLTQDVLRRLVPPIEPIEDLAPTPKEIGAPISDRTVPNLEPPRAEQIRQTTPISDEPRLVIGQLRVDILPAGPTETREVVRVVQSGASRTLRPSPVSKLRFGLGQM
jgi:hypothetical protein